MEMRDNGPEARTITTKADRETHRSIYLPLLRGVTPKALEVFDPAEQTLVTGRRETTTVPTQALFLLNSPFVRKHALALAESVLQDGDDTARVQAAYRRALGRPATAAEVERALAFVGEYGSAAKDEVYVPAKPQAAPTAKPKAKVDSNANPDEVDQADEPVEEESVRPKDARTAAWMSLAQALLGSAEFRYVR